MKRYSTKQLFQYRVGKPGPGARERRTCEERIFLLQARSDKEALKKAKARGKAAELKYQGDDGLVIYFEFVGLLDLVCLDPTCEPDEVWYDIRQYLNPMERRAKLIPSDEELLKKI